MTQKWKPSRSTAASGHVYAGISKAEAWTLDKEQAAVLESEKAHPLSGPAFGAVTEEIGHRNSLKKDDAVYK